LEGQVRAGDYIAALQDLPCGTVEDLTGCQPFLVLSPHPDDETLGCGGLLAAAASQDISAHVLILTDGAASHPRSSSHPAERLTALRRDEARRALACLGLSEHRLGFLDLRDAATPAGGPEFDAAVDDIAHYAAAIGARRLFVTWGHDPHCDHETAYAMARGAARRLGSGLHAYPVWGLHLPPDTQIDEAPPCGVRLDISAHRAQKKHALDCYASQMTDLIDDDPTAFRFTAAQLVPFLEPDETYIEVVP
jgi:LmbE family N-acetylglucosaminyl deacetylase